MITASFARVVRSARSTVAVRSFLFLYFISSILFSRRAPKPSRDVERPRTEAMLFYEPGIESTRSQKRKKKRRTPSEKPVRLNRRLSVTGFAMRDARRRYEHER